MLAVCARGRCRTHVVQAYTYCDQRGQWHGTAQLAYQVACACLVMNAALLLCASLWPAFVQAEEYPKRMVCRMVPARYRHSQCNSQLICIAEDDIPRTNAWLFATSRRHSRR